MRLLRRALTKIPKDRDLLQGRGRGALAFVHIPKTAGTWFSRFLMQHFTEAEIAPTHHTLPESMNFGDVSKRFFCGHFRFLAIETERPLRLVTFLRDPFKRTESHYRSWREHGDPLIAGDNSAVAEAVRWTRQTTYEQFVCSQNPIIESSIRNVQTAYLTSIPKHDDPGFLSSACENLEKRFLFLGLQEFSAESLRLFSFQTGAATQPIFPTLNTTKPCDISLSAAARQRLADLLHYDIKLYEFGQRLFKRRLAAI